MYFLSQLKKVYVLLFLLTSPCLIASPSRAAVVMRSSSCGNEGTSEATEFDSLLGSSPFTTKVTAGVQQGQSQGK